MRSTGREKRREERREMNGNAESVRLMFQEVLYTWTQCGGQASVTRVIMKIPLMFWQEDCPKVQRHTKTESVTERRRDSFDARVLVLTMMVMR